MTRSELLRTWTFEPVLVVALVVTTILYARGTARLRQRITGTARLGRALSFYGGLLALAAALMSPIDALSAALFSAHMVQHLLLMVVAAPLLVLARPIGALVAGLPEGGRDAVRAVRSEGVRGAARTLTHPVVVWIVGTVAVWAWHMPSLYEAALANDALHVAEHASFLGAAVLFWSVVLGSGTRRGPAARPIAALLVFANGVQGTALGAVLLFASTALYPVHAAGARVWGTTPLEDQQLAGALMWGPPAFVYLVTLGWLLVRWFAEMEPASPDRLLVATGERP
ncbi:MAG: cytochrome c oxidase assembly protein [Actinomycetota bacterium]|nr:cytochrome c oxidase assembly protein [Actinomycetota bacterium]